jgi:hypothetical protein
MTGQKTAHKISSFAAPTEEDFAHFESLADDDKRALLRAEIEKGVAGGLSKQTFAEIIADERAKLSARRDENG